MRSLAVIALMALAPLTAYGNPEARQIAERGFTAYDSAEYATAITYFERAYEIEPTPGLLFNIAQAYRKLGPTGCERALAYYQRYRDALAQSGLPVEEGLRARILEMQACVESGAVPDDPQVEVDEVASPEKDPVVEPGPSTKRRAAWILVGTGAAATVTAVVTGALALDRQSDLQSRCEGDVCPPSLEGRVRGYDRLRFVAFSSGAIGIAALAVGGYLLIGSKRSEPARLGVQPVLGPGTIAVRCDF